MRNILISCSLMVLMAVLATQAMAASYPVVDTAQKMCFDDRKQIACPEPSASFYGQDSQYLGNQPRYRDNGDGTVSDLVTGLMWVKDRGEQKTFSNAMSGAAQCRVGGYTDWRAPTIKELYSLIDFNGYVQSTEAASTPFIDTDHFGFAYGDTSRGERIIDCQDWSATIYKDKTMKRNTTSFGVNFCDGRIKGYGIDGRRVVKKYMRYVRGNPAYGRNEFVAKGDGTVLDKATTLVWMQNDAGKTMNWEEALDYCETLDFAGRSDWRLPNVKELQSIVDYTRSPGSSSSAAMDPVFVVTDIESYFWSSTTHMDGPRPQMASYVAFGRALGYFSPPNSNADKELMDVHGAGAQRSEFKSGDPGRYPQGHGPQGDDIRIYNHVRCVAGGVATATEPENPAMNQWSGKGSGSGMDSNNPNGQMNRGNRMNSSNMGNQGNQGRMGGQQQGSMGRRQPPQQAYDACTGKTSGSNCSFQSPRGTISGQCKDHGGDLICLPSNHGGMGRPN